MSIFNTGQVTPSVEDIKGIGEALKEEAFSMPGISDFQTLVEGIIVKKKMVILGRLQGMIGKGSGGCDQVNDDNEFGAIEKFLDPQTVSVRLVQCYETSEDKFTAWGLKFGIERADLTGTDFADYVVELILVALIESVFRHAWFGDVDAANVVDLGVITNGIDVDYFNKINGFWKQIFAIVAADPARKSAGFATKNAQATYALQEFNDTDTTNRVATKAYQALRFKADMRLRGIAEKMIVSTQSGVDQYEQELIAQGSVYNIDYIMDGITMLKTGAISILAFDFFDRTIRESYDNGTSYYLPHRAVLLNPVNMQIATNASKTFTEVGVVFDNVKDEVIFKANYKIDAKIGFDHQIQALY